MVVNSIVRIGRSFLRRFHHRKPIMEFKQDLEDSTQCLAVFSAEVWSIILDNLDCANDFQNISRTSTLFRALLLPKRPVLLFKDVVKIMVHRLGKIRTQEAWNLQTLLSLRLVCRSWMKAVNSILQTLSTPSIAAEMCIMGWRSCITRFDSSECVLKFQKHFQATHYSTGRNPIISRTLVIDLSSDVYDPYYFQNNLHKVLRSYGTHVWTCAINLDDFGGLEELYGSFPLLFEQLPNLKTFVFNSNGFEKLGRDKMWQLRRAMNKNPLPVLEKLEHVSNIGIHLPVFECLIRSAPQLHKIDAFGLQNALYPCKRLLKHVKTCLEEVPKLKSFSTTIGSLSEWKEINTAKLNCQVVSLRIGFQIYIGWGSIFKMLEQFGDFLEQLTVSLPKSKTTDKVAKLRLPKLKVVQLRLQGNEPLDCLLPMRDHLQKLVVENIKLLNEANQTEGNMQDFQEAYNKPKLTLMFPKLKTFILKPIDEDSV